MPTTFSYARYGTAVQAAANNNHEPAMDFKNPFRNPMMRAWFESAVHAYQTQHRDLFINGTRRTPGNYGSSYATDFWHGYDNVTFGRGWDAQSKQTLGYALWRAGREIAKREGRK